MFEAHFCSHGDPGSGLGDWLEFVLVVLSGFELENSLSDFEFHAGVDSGDSGSEELEGGEEDVDGLSGADEGDRLVLSLVQNSDDVGDVRESSSEGFDSDLVFFDWSVLVSDEFVLFV